MNAGLLIFLGMLLIGAGIYSFMRRDQVWEGQVSANEMRGLTSERTESWDIMQSFRAVISIVLGLIALVGGLAAAFAPQPPVGRYTCSNGSIYNAPVSLVLQSDGTGTYDGHPLTWSSASGPKKKVIFDGDTSLVSGEFPAPSDLKSFVLTRSNGENQFCLLK